MKIDIYRKGTETRVKGKPVLEPDVRFRSPYASAVSQSSSMAYRDSYDLQTGEVLYKIRYCKAMKEFIASYKDYYVKAGGLDYEITDVDYLIGSRREYMYLRCKRGV